MNMLSLLIYGADVLQNLAGFLVVACALFTIGLLVSILVNATSLDGISSYSKSFEQIELEKRPYRNARNKSAKLLLIPFFVGLLVNFIPSQNTVYLVAGSELAEAGYKTELGQKLSTVVNEKIEKYIEDMTVEKVTDKFDFSKLTSEEKNAIVKRLTGETN